MDYDSRNRAAAYADALAYIAGNRWSAIAAKETRDGRRREIVVTVRPPVAGGDAYWEVLTYRNWRRIAGESGFVHVETAAAFCANWLVTHGYILPLPLV